MTRQEIREQLLRVGSIVREQRRIADEIATLRARQESVSKVISEAPGGSGKAYTLDDYVADLDQLERKYLDRIREEREAYGAALRLLDQLTGLKRDVMIEHYLMLRSWEQIAVDYDKSYRYIMKLNRKALDELSEKSGGVH